MIRAAWAVGVGVLVLAGCAGKDGERPVFPVRGRVLYQGKPAPGAEVFFHPVGPADPKAQRPHGKTDADGAFSLTTRKAGDGAPEGDYTVTVVWPAAETADEPADRLKGRYNRPAESKIRVRVGPGENALDPFALQ